jgi:hypothetical protein
MKVTVNNSGEIDWNKKGQIVIGEGKTIVITTGIHSGSDFHGFSLSSSTYCGGWEKKFFSLYKGSITLEND